MSYGGHGTIIDCPRIQFLDTRETFFTISNGEIQSMTKPLPCIEEYKKIPSMIQEIRRQCMDQSGD